MLEFLNDGFASTSREDVVCLGGRKFGVRWDAWAQSCLANTPVRHPTAFTDDELNSNTPQVKAATAVLMIHVAIASYYAHREEPSPLTIEQVSEMAHDELLALFMMQSPPDEEAGPGHWALHRVMLIQDVVMRVIAPDEWGIQDD